MKSQLVPVTITGVNANSSGLAFSRLVAGSTPVDGVPLGIDAGGNVIAIESVQPSALLTDISNAGNSTADVTVASVNIPLNGLLVGSTFELRGRGLQSNAALASTFNFFIKLNTTKVVTISMVSATLGASNLPWKMDGLITVRAIGASGSLAASLHISSLQSNTAQQQMQVAATPSINTTVVNTLSFGFNWTTANAANIVTANQCIISPI